MAGAGVQGQESIVVLLEKVVKREELKLSNGTGKEIRQNNIQLLVSVERTMMDRSIMVINIIISERTSDINTELFASG